jgi:hypothetical protein
MDRLNVFRMVVSPCSAHATGMDVVGHDVAIISERFVTQSAFTVLSGNLSIKELPHFSVGAEFPVPSGMMLIFNAPDAHLARASFSRHCLSATAETGAVDRAELVLVESHGALLIGLGPWFDWGSLRRLENGRKTFDARY